MTPRRVCTNKRSRALRHDVSAIVEFGKSRPRDELRQCVSTRVLQKSHRGAKMGDQPRSLSG